MLACLTTTDFDQKTHCVSFGVKEFIVLHLTKIGCVLHNKEGDAEYYKMGEVYYIVTEINEAQLAEIKKYLIVNNELPKV